MLRRRGDGLRFIPPVSLVLARRTDAYIEGLVGYRRVDEWCARFESEWIERLGHPRSDAASLQIIRALPAQPVLDVKAGQALTGKSHVAVGNAVARLEEAGILTRLNEKRWGRLWECQELLELVSRFEESLLTP